MRDNPDMPPAHARKSWVWKRLKELLDFYKQRVTLPLATSVALGQVFGLLLLWQGLATGLNTDLPSVAVMTGMVLGLLVVLVLIHELGHALTAVMVGLRLLQINIGPLQFARRGETFRLRLVRARNRPLGFVVSVPIEEQSMHWHMGLCICGGALANVLAGALCLAVSPLFNHASSANTVGGWRDNPFLMPRNILTGFLNVAGLLNIWVACATLVPGRSRGHASDGARLLELFSGRNRGERNLLLTVLAGSMVTGTRPRDWDPALLERMLSYRDNKPEDANANLYGYYHGIDKRQFEEAGKFLDLALVQREGYPAFARAALFYEGAYFEAVAPILA